MNALLGYAYISIT